MHENLTVLSTDRLGKGRTLYMNKSGDVLAYMPELGYCEYMFMSNCCNAAVSCNDMGMYCKYCFHHVPMHLGGIPQKGLDY